MRENMDLIAYLREQMEKVLSKSSPMGSESGDTEIAAIALESLKRTEKFDVGETVCQWTALPYIEPGEKVAHLHGPSHCDNVATHTTCDPIEGKVCADHRCRCSKPLAERPNRYSRKNRPTIVCLCFTSEED